jgi:hypothetical protein
VPVAIFILVAWYLLIRPNADALVNIATPVVAGCVLLAVFLPFSLQLSAILMIGLVALITWRTREAPVPAHGQ